MYSRFAIPDLLALSLLQPLRILLRSKGITWPLLWSNLLSLFLHIPITIYLTFYLSLGVKGLAISSFLHNSITLFILISFSLFPFRRHFNIFFTNIIDVEKFVTSTNRGGLMCRAKPGCSTGEMGITNSTRYTKLSWGLFRVVVV